MTIYFGESTMPACDPELLRELAQYGVADLHESLPSIRQRTSLMSAGMRPVSAGIRAVGQVVTATTVPGDNLILYAGLQIIQPGQILLMSNGGVPHGALFGDVSASFAMKIGVAGIVVDGPVRDVSALREMGCPVWSSVISPSHPEKLGPGSVNVPVSCAGVIVNPGDVLVADDDAVLVLRPEDIPSVLATAEMRKQREIEYRERIERGEHICDILGMRAIVAAKTLAAKA